MNSEEEQAHSQFSEPSSISDMIHEARDREQPSSRKSSLQRQNQILRENLANQIAENEKLQEELNRKDAKYAKLDSFYKKQIQQLSQKSKLPASSKRNSLRKGKGPENQDPNHANRPRGNRKLNLDESLLKARSINNRVLSLKKQLQKVSMEQAYTKVSQMMEDLALKSESGGDQISRSFVSLKKKMGDLQNNPLAIDLYSKRDAEELDALFVSLNKNMKVLSRVSEFQGLPS